MNCRTAESMVHRYINHSLNIEEVEAFLDHMESCSACYDELETYYIVHKAMQQLDEDEGEVLDFQNLLEQDIKKSRNYVRKKKIGRFLAVVLILMLLGALVAFLVYIFFEVQQIL